MFAAGCVLLAATAHALMSGAPLPGWALLAAFGGVGGLGWLSGGRERGPLAVTGLTVGVQALLHAVFSLGQAATAAPAPGGIAAQWARLLLCGTGPPGGAGQLSAGPAGAEQVARLVEAAGIAPGDGMTVVPLDEPATAATSGMAAMPDMPGMAMGHHAVAVVAGHQHGATLGMLAAHLLAALLLGRWLAAGERAVHGLARTVAARLFAPVLLLIGAVRPAVPRRLGRPHRAARRPGPPPHLRSPATRGPPGPAAVR